jgi:hypothetical protein
MTTESLKVSPTAPTTSNIKMYKNCYRLIEITNIFFPLSSYSCLDVRFEISFAGRRKGGLCLTPKNLKTCSHFNYVSETLKLPSHHPCIQGKMT